MPDVRLPRSVRALGGAAVLVIAAAALVACQPEPAPTTAPGGSPSPSATASRGAPTPSVEPSDPAATAFAMPEACEQAYSAAMFEELGSTIAPLNDPGVTMLSTENAALLETLDSGVPSLRCTWGPPSERGMATTIAAVDADTAEAVRNALAASGFGCEGLGDGTVCRIEQRGISLDDVEYARGETHYVGDGGWVATAWLNIDPPGYTQDIVTTLWG